MASSEVVALDQARWAVTAETLKLNLERARLRILGLAIGAAILEVLAVQIHVPFPAASQVAGYAGALALAAVVVVRARGLSRKRVQTWVLAQAAAQSLKSEMYHYRTSSGPYSDYIGANFEATLLERRNEILEKVKSIERYTVKSDPKAAVVGPLDADSYVAERVDGEIKGFRRWADHFVAAQGFWLKVEYCLAIGGALLGAALTFTHNQAYGGWVAVITTISVAVGADTLAERYAQLTLGYRAMPDRLTSILARWRANHGTLSQLVEQVEITLLEENQGWVAGATEFVKSAASPPATFLGPKLARQSPAIHTALK